MKTRKRVTPAAIAVAAMIAAAPVGAQDLSDATIGYSIPVSGLEVIDNFAETLKETTMRSGQADFVVVSAEGDPLKQTTDVEGLAAQGADAVIITAASDVGWELAIQTVAETGSQATPSRSGPQSGSGRGAPERSERRTGSSNT